MKLTNINKFLLALLLALKDLKTPLSDTEQSKLSEAVEKLIANIQAWEILIEPSLLEIIQGNEALNQQFQVVKSKLDSLGENIPLNLLPSTDELEEAVPISKLQPATRAILQVTSSDLRSDEITNMVIRVLDTPNPSETVKKLSSFGQIQEFLNVHISAM